MKFLRRTQFSFLACAALLGGCGGGAGGGDAVAGTAPTTGVQPPPAVAPLIGKVWHSFSDLGNPSGTFATDPNTGASTRIYDQKYGVPWSDGKQFINGEYVSQGSTGETRLTIRRVGDSSMLVDQLVDGDFSAITPSPSGGNRILAYWGTNASAQKSVVVWDFDARKLLFATPPSDTPDAVAWMPDGTVLRLQRSGSVSKVTLGGTQMLLTSVSWPESRIPLNAFVSPDGTQVLVQLVKLKASGSIDSSDLWMLDIQGSKLRRFTNNGLVPYAVWSPDGRFVAFAKDTGYSCSESTCMGSCTIWYADSTASNVQARETSGDAKQFPLQRPDGSKTTLSCPVMAWTR